MCEGRRTPETASLQAGSEEVLSDESPEGVVLTIVVLVGGGLPCVSRVPTVPADYAQTVATGGLIEARYLVKGPYVVTSRKEPVLQGSGGYVLYFYLQFHCRAALLHTVFASLSDSASTRRPA